MEQKKQKIIDEFNRIKELGFIKSNRPNNKDGGIGNTFEDYLGVTENNLRDPDFEGFEIKSKRQMNASYMTLFSKSPSHPRGANALLKDRFGEIRDDKFPDLCKLYASIFGHRDSLVYGKNYMTMNVDRTNERLYLHVTNVDSGEVFDEVYWDFEDLRRASSKMKSLFVVFAEQKLIDDVYNYHYNEAIIYLGFSFDNFINCIEDGSIMFDMRMGVHSSGKNYGKPHDHGSGFRIAKSNINKLFLEEIHVK